MITCIFENDRKASLRHVVVDNLVIQNNKILLVKRTKGLLEAGKWGLVGGFMERGETIMDAVEREIFEETGWRVSNITLLRIKDKPTRPNDGERQNVAFTFFCQAEKKEGEEDSESDEVKWFNLDSLPADSEFAFDHAEDVKIYKEYRKQAFSLPISLQ